MENISIRLCRSNEVKDLALFARTLFHEAFAHQNDPVHFESYTSQAFSHKAFHSLHENHQVDFYLTLHQQNPIGYMQINEGDAQTELELDNAIEIQRIYVSTNFQNQGIGKRMIDYAKSLSISRSKSWLWLGVWEHNPAAQSFYKREGFVPFSSHTFMLGDDPQTDVMLRWKVRP